MIVFDILLPTTDVIGDVIFSIEALLKSHMLIGFVMLIFVILSVICEVYKWIKTDFDTEKEKKITWLLALLHLWPQYQSCKLIWSILRGTRTDLWEKQHEKIKSQLSCIAPLIESLPQFFVELSIYTMLVTRDSGGANQGYGQRWSTFYTAIWSGTETQVEVIFGATTFGISNEIMFPLKVLISLISSIECVVQCVYNEEANTKSRCPGFKIINFFCVLIYVISSFLWKIHIIQQFIMFGTDLQVNGFWIFMIVFILFVLIPSLFIYPPLFQYFGFRNAIQILCTYPKFMIIPLVTEYVYGPSEGYGSSPSEVEPKLTINKGLSTAKLLYFSLFYVFLVIPL